MKKYFCIVAALAMMVLSGCDNVRNVLSFPRGGPDEFSVTTNQPLVIPPDYDLRPPTTDAGSADATETLFQESTDSGTDANDGEQGELTVGEEALLQHLESLERGPEDAQASSPSAGESNSDDPVVDALGEAKRIESGEDGGTPVIEDAETDSIFGNFWDYF